ncbi:uncharacterized protein LOC119028018 isoform X2 [Acanthopagrus latus]|uniref:uncharacterized protein LOC119028018 isoform X2 n=1 Tax=Acanthopagrus latus TaxID=8177 RepID=UPI00187CBF40|nr:uncharacterized protein LOC119028018 isoform X2 [Acanthopagrus latus]
MAGNNIRAVTNTEQPSVAHPSFHQRSKPMSLRRKLAHPPTSRLTPPAHPTSSYSEKTAVNTQEEVPGLEDWRTEDFPDLTPDNNEGLLQQPPRHPLPELLQRTNDMTTVNWQQEAEYEGLGSPELSPPSCPDLPHRIPQMSPLSRPDPPHRIPQNFPDQLLLDAQLLKGSFWSRSENCSSKWITSSNYCKKIIQFHMTTSI